jgi:hypothetical protein
MKHIALIIFLLPLISACSKEDGTINRVDGYQTFRQIKGTWKLESYFSNSGSGTYSNYDQTFNSSLCNLKDHKLKCTTISTYSNEFESSKTETIDSSFFDMSLTFSKYSKNSQELKYSIRIIQKDFNSSSESIQNTDLTQSWKNSGAVITIDNCEYTLTVTNDVIELVYDDHASSPPLGAVGSSSSSQKRLSFRRVE